MSPKHQETYERAADFIWRNARLLERYRFAYHFMDGPKSAVLASLRSYQNTDGGFGNAIEPDVRFPGSTPIGVATAFYILDEVDGFADPMVRQACDFLITISSADGGLPFTLPQVKTYPHGPWWATDDPNPPAEINPTGDIAGLLLKHNISHPWLSRAVPFCWQAQDPTRTGFHEIMPAVEFLAHAPDQDRAQPVLAEIKDTIRRENLVVFDRSTEGYVKFPLDWAPDPEHQLRDLFTTEEIEADLQALVDTQLEDGGWPINWPTVGPAIDLEWRGVFTLNNLLKLRAYGWL